MRKVTVSAKIDEELRKRLRDLSIKPSEVIRRALEEEVERKQELYKKVEAASQIVSKVGAVDWVKGDKGEQGGKIASTHGRW